MYRIVTRTGRTIQTGIVSLKSAANKLKLLEFEAKRTDTYSPGYYRIEKDEAPSELAGK